MWHGVLLVLARLILWKLRPPPRHYRYVAAVTLALIVVIVGAERLKLWPEAWKVNPRASPSMVATKFSDATAAGQFRHRV